MKKHLLIPLIALWLPGNGVFAQNPFISHMYTADPSARVFNDTLYVYPSHDSDTATWFSMADWHVFSTTDMVNWTDHGVALSVDDLSWADYEDWAPDVNSATGSIISTILSNLGSRRHGHQATGKIQGETFCYQI